MATKTVSLTMENRVGGFETWTVRQQSENGDIVWTLVSPDKGIRRVHAFSLYATGFTSRVGVVTGNVAVSPVSRTVGVEMKLPLVGVVGDTANEDIFVVASEIDDRLRHAVMIWRPGQEWIVNLAELDNAGTPAVVVHLWMVCEVIG